MSIYVAVVHGPVKNKNGDLVTTAVTGLSIHDVARCAVTYGASAYFLVTTLAAQKRLVERITSHWEAGFGDTYNPNRKVALGIIEVVDDLAAAIKEVTEREGVAPQVVATTARQVEGTERVSFADLRQRLKEPGPPTLLVFGTGWGLPLPVLEGADQLLAPIHGPGDYNHLSVRSAVAVVLDRLLGE